MLFRNELKANRGHYVTRKRKKGYKSVKSEAGIMTSNNMSIFDNLIGPLNMWIHRLQLHKVVMFGETCKLFPECNRVVMSVNLFFRFYTIAVVVGI